MKKKVIPPSVIDKAHTLKKQGFTRRQIAEALRISYHTVQNIFGQERLGIDRSNKKPWTIENLKKLQEVYMDLPIRDVCLMFNRDRYEIRQLLYNLDWEIPTTFFRSDKEKIKDKILELCNKYNQKEISIILKIPHSNIQSICQENGIVCSRNRGTLKKEKLKTMRTPANIMKEAYAEASKLFREKHKQKETNEKEHKSK